MLDLKYETGRNNRGNIGNSRKKQGKPYPKHGEMLGEMEGSMYRIAGNWEFLAT